MPRISVRLGGDLPELLPRRAEAPFDVSAPLDATVVAIVEDLGIPHTEIGSMSVNGRPSAFDYRPADGDELSVHPIGQAADRDGASPRFVLDVHLGRLARLLRLLGFDTSWSRDASDAELAGVSSRECRILLSRDRGLLKRREVRQGCLVLSQSAREQAAQVVARYGLRRRLAPFSRCLVCNALLERPATSDADGAPRATGRCPGCGRRYWRGSHWEAMARLVEEIRGGG